MRKIGVVNMKGGVGKTTTAIHIAAGLAHEGVRVLLVDADPQGNVASQFQLHPRATIEDLLVDAVPLEEVVVAARPNLDVIAAMPSAFALEGRLAAVADREMLLARRLEPLRAYDALILDSSPAVNLLTYNALLCAEEVVVPVAMDPMAIMGAVQTLRGVSHIRKLWPEHPVRILAILPVAMNHATHATRATLDALAHDPQLQPFLYAPGIRQCLDLTYAAAARQTIWEYAPRSKAAHDYTAFVHFVKHGCNREAVEGGQGEEAIETVL